MVSSEHRGHARGVPLRLLAGILALAVLAVFSRALEGEFLRGDDEPYVTKNPVVLRGLTGEGFLWAFRLQGHAAAWHPLTWISHMADVEAFGLNPAGHHVASVLLHAASTVLVFLILARITGATWRSAFVAAVFGLHPLRVESVAWIAERKDVLSVFFWMLTLGAYVRYVERPGRIRYLAALLGFTLGLLAKPMLVTLPFVLLLLDYWPLRRASARGFPRLLLEKVPFLMLTVLSSVITFITQRIHGAVSPLEELPLAARLGNALLAYAGYLAKLLVPVRLSPFYPHPGSHLPAGPVLVAALVLLAISAIVIVRRNRPYLTVGWLWYLGTLIPVIGLVQIGDHAMADRFTYIPLLGVTLMVVWTVGDWIGPWLESARGTVRRRRRRIVVLLGGSYLFALAVITFIQIGYWHDTVSLYRHAVAVTRGNYVAHNNLGQGLMDVGRYREAADQYAAAIALDPGRAEVYCNLGIALTNVGEIDEALDRFDQGLALERRRTRGRGDPASANIQYCAALALLQGGRQDAALDRLRDAVRLDPEFAPAQYALGKELGDRGAHTEAILHYRAALRADPGMVPAWNNLAVALFMNGEDAAAWEAVRACRALGFEPAPEFVRALASRTPEP